ncbi:MAG: acyloxyacyl hydrolase [Bacteroidetes bacterium]|nr:acyloxyacyl hydrolase [Bacteroidota bacterium]
MSRQILSFFFFLLPSVGIHAGTADSDSLKGYNIEARMHYSAIMPHRRVMSNVMSGHFFASDVCFSKQTFGKRNYEKAFRYPVIGGGYYFAGLDADIFGDLHAIYSFISIPIIRREKFTFAYQITPGLAWLTRPFDAKENYMNTIIGSHLNFYFNLGFDFKLKINSSLDWISGFGLTHFSNGAQKLPNLGINIIGLNTGLRYKFRREKRKFPDRTLPDFHRKFELLITASAGGRDITEVRDKMYFVSSFSADAGWIVSYIRRVGIGFDLFYDRSIGTRLRKEGYDTVRFAYYLRPGLHLSHDLIIDRFSIVLQAGCYVYSEWDEDGYIYTRIGFRYKVTKRFYTTVAMRTHYAKAHFIEWGLGVAFDKLNNNTTSFRE